jgi:hypothetical protein
MGRGDETSAELADLAPGDRIFPHGMPVTARRLTGKPVTAKLRCDLAMGTGRLHIPRVNRQDLWEGARMLWPDRLEAAVLFILTVAIAYQLLVDPIVGMADNRDFARLMDPAGLDYRSVADYRETVFQFVETKFAFVKPSSHRYLTSQRPILAAAKVLNGVLAKDDKFDLRSLGLCNLALYVAERNGEALLHLQRRGRSLPAHVPDQLG